MMSPVANFHRKSFLLATSDDNSLAATGSSCGSAKGEEVTGAAGSSGGADGSCGDSTVEITATVGNGLAERGESGSATAAGTGFVEHPAKWQTAETRQQIAKK